jgi:hypothetical protein
MWKMHEMEILEMGEMHETGRYMKWRKSMKRTTDDMDDTRLSF